MNASRNKIVGVISLVLFVVMVGLLISMHRVDKQTTDTVSFYTATVTDVKIINSGKNASVEIHMEEFDMYLYITQEVCRNIELNDIKNLRNGQTIYFGIEKAKVQYMNTAEFVDIISLRTDTSDIFTLKDYNLWMSSATYLARIMCIAMAVLLLLVLVYCYVKRK